MDTLNDIEKLLKETSASNEFDKYWDLSNLDRGGIKQHIESEILERSNNDTITLYR